jgi:glutamate synthase domain-containing protein 2
MAPRSLATAPFRLKVGEPDCRRPYDASIFNISAMSFGALSANAIRALNKGAKAGNFAHDTGEGGLPPTIARTGATSFGKSAQAISAPATPTAHFQRSDLLRPPRSTRSRWSN